MFICCGPLLYFFAISFLWCVFILFIVLALRLQLVKTLALPPYHRTLPSLLLSRPPLLHPMACRRPRPSACPRPRPSTCAAHRASLHPRPLACPRPHRTLCVVLRHHSPLLHINNNSS